MLGGESVLLKLTDLIQLSYITNNLLYNVFIQLV
jgi:hypothetical protein